MIAPDLGPSSMTIQIRKTLQNTMVQRLIRATETAFLNAGCTGTPPLSFLISYVSILFFFWIAIIKAESASEIPASVPAPEIALIINRMTAISEQAPETIPVPMKNTPAKHRRIKFG